VSETRFLEMVYLPSTYFSSFSQGCQKVHFQTNKIG
jgi:hypothetical protein